MFESKIKMLLKLLAIEWSLVVLKLGLIAGINVNSQSFEGFAIALIDF